MDPFSNYRLRSPTPEDHTFLWELHQEAYKHYVEELWGWNEEFQWKHFERRMASADLVKHVVYTTEERAGYLELSSKQDLVHIDNILIASSHQSKGLGSWMLETVMDDAQDRQKDVALQVFHINPRAIEFYRRLGFNGVGVSETHVLMRWFHDP